MQTLVDRIHYVHGDVYADSGILRCTTHNPDPDQAQWCEHIKQVVEDGEDANLKGIDQAGFLSVPMFPNEGYWFSVNIEETVIAGGRKIMLPNEDSVFFDDEFIGFLMPGEGRKVVRAMLLDWAKPKYNKMVQCKNKSHGVAAEKVVQQMLRDPKQKFVHIWSVVTERLCKVCRDKAESIDFSEFAPEF